MVTSRERFLTAMRNGIPDRVPAAPDISTYIPMKRAGLSPSDFWILREKPLWRAYLEAADYFGIDAWTGPAFWLPTVNEDAPVEWKSESRVDGSRDVLVSTSTVKTPDGELTQESICHRGDQPATSQKLIKDLSRDFRKFRHTQSMPKAIDRPTLELFRRETHTRGYAFGLTVTYPGFHMWEVTVQGGVEALTYAEADTPELLQEWLELDMERGTRLMELVLQADLDYLLFGGSGTVTMASPALAQKYAIPALKKWSRMAKEAGLPTMLHSCGKDRALARLLVDETDVLMLNPLEPPPAGDIDLAEVKRTYGHRLSFMGNLHTTDVMLKGTPESVRRKAVKAMRDAGVGGGFILSTGDQCGRDTPEENIFAVVEAAKAYGRYDPTTGALPDLP